jgi:hypothetical protein
MPSEASKSPTKCSPDMVEKKSTAPLIEVETVDHWVAHFERFDIDGF